MNRPQRFNAKARRSGATFSHKRGKQRYPKTQPAPADTNLEVVQHKSTEQKKLDRREQLKKEVRLYSLHDIFRSRVVVTRTISIKSIQQEEEEVG